MKMIKIIPVLLIGLFLSSNAGATSINDEDTLSTGYMVNMESWMFDTNYLTNATQAVEAWMLDGNWLDEAADESAIECWMLDADYLDEDTTLVESWMLDSDYLNNYSGNVN